MNVGGVRVGVMPPLVAALMMAKFMAGAPPTPAPGHMAAVPPPVPPPAPPAPPPAAPAAPPAPPPRPRPPWLHRRRRPPVAPFQPRPGRMAAAARNPTGPAAFAARAAPTGSRVVRARRAGHRAEAAQRDDQEEILQMFTHGQDPFHSQKPWWQVLPPVQVLVPVPVHSGAVRRGRLRDRRLEGAAAGVGRRRSRRADHRRWCA